MGNKGYKWFYRISLTVYFLFFLVFGNKILKDNFYIITALFSVVLIILILNETTKYLISDLHCTKRTDSARFCLVPFVLAIQYNFYLHLLNRLADY